MCEATNNRQDMAKRMYTSQPRLWIVVGKVGKPLVDFFARIILMDKNLLSGAYSLCINYTRTMLSGSNVAGKNATRMLRQWSKIIAGSRMRVVPALTCVGTWGADCGERPGACGTSTAPGVTTRCAGLRDVSLSVLEYRSFNSLVVKFTATVNTLARMRNGTRSLHKTNLGSLVQPDISTQHNCYPPAIERSTERGTGCSWTSYF